jgi:fucose 4-O-acetylase-like acetyltransferase
MTQRLEYIDSLKGTAILCITFLHFEYGVIPNWLNAWIGNFMITAFYFSSGWLMGMRDRTPSPKELIKKRLHSLGIPYLYFSLIIFIFDIIWYMCGNYDFQYLLTDIYKTITLRGIGTLWFLPALFFGELIFIWLRKKNNIWTLLCVILTLLYLNYYGNLSYEYRELTIVNKIIDAPFRTIRNVLGAWPVVFMGFHIAKWYNFHLAHEKRSVIMYWGMILIILSVYINGFYLFGFGVLNSFIRTSVAPFGITLLFIIIGPKVFLKPVIYWGKNSLILMVVHYSITLVICKYICANWLNHPFIGWITIGFFFVSVLLNYPIAEIVNSKFPGLLGRKTTSKFEI